MARRRRSINQMNVVPYIDVMLVLLVIFMVTSPAITPGEIKLPSVGTNLTPPPTDPLEITLKADHSLLLRDGGKASKLDQASLIDTIKTRQLQNPGRAVVIMADKSTRYEYVIALIGDLQAAAITRVGLLAKTEAPK